MPALPIHDLPSPASDTARQICDYLDSEGFKGEIDDDGDIVFRCEGLAYLLCLDSADPQWGRLVVPFVWEWDSAQESADVMQAVDFVNRRSKLVKAYSVNNRVHLSIQLLLEPVSCWSSILLRCVRALAEARTLMINAIRLPELVTLDLQKLAQTQTDKHNTPPATTH
ncbi:hypothetical protein [Aquabacterium sp.]|uniref:hypothetical protein n=1 Tax=Aquabacterium sp. TaxID=1872578 RepID=UPI003BF5747A